MHCSNVYCKKELILLILGLYLWTSSYISYNLFSVQTNKNQNNNTITISEENNHLIFDFIVIGSATGGVTATRLSEAGYKVLLIESGPNDLTFTCTNCGSLPTGDFIKGTSLIPDKGWLWEKVKQLNWQNAQSMKSYWNYNKTVLDHFDTIKRAKMLGGCLSHNGNNWARGSTRDFDFVAKELNLTDWSFKNVLIYFQKLEKYFGENKTFRGNNGPIHLYETTIKKWENKLQAIYDYAINYGGLPKNNHQNGGHSQYGIGVSDTNIRKYENGTYGLYNTKFYRESSSQSYIRNIGVFYDLTIWYNTTVQRILFDKNKVAIGVEYWLNNTSNQLNKIYCKYEVIISCGAYQSPQLLMLSGIGRKDELNKFNITPVYIGKSAQNIGKFGQDHKMYSVKYRITDMNTITNNKYDGNVQWNGWLFDNEGKVRIYLSSNLFNRLGYDYNDISVRIQDWDDASDMITMYIDAATYSKNLTIELRSLDSRTFPKVYNYYFSDSRDYDIVIAAIYKLREIFESDLFAEVMPGINKTIDELRDDIWRTSKTALHAVGTVSMGSNNNYPVDGKCRLRGVKGVRVVDASIWPYSTNAGTMSLVFMLGEKCAQHIIDDH